MSSKGVPKFKVQALEQVCMVVPDLQKAMESMWNNFGIGPWRVHHLRSSDLSDMTYHGRPGRFGMAIARAKVGTSEIELIQPTEGESTYTDFLKKHGFGVHHLGWYKVKNVAETIQLMEKAGFPCVTSGRTRYNVQFAYFDTVRVLGTILEALYRDESVPAPPPERIWPE